MYIYTYKHIFKRGAPLHPAARGQNPKHALHLVICMLLKSRFLFDEVRKLTVKTAARMLPFPTRHSSVREFTKGGLAKRGLAIRHVFNLRIKKRNLMYCDCTRETHKLHEGNPPLQQREKKLLQLQLFITIVYYPIVYYNCNRLLPNRLLQLHEGSA